MSQKEHFTERNGKFLRNKSTVNPATSVSCVDDKACLSRSNVPPTTLRSGRLFYARANSGVDVTAGPERGREPTRGVAVGRRSEAGAALQEPTRGSAESGRRTERTAAPRRSVVRHRLF